MKMKLAGLLVGAIALTVAAPAQAETLSDRMGAAFSANSGDIFYNSTTWRQSQLLLNAPTPESEYNKDSQMMEQIYRDGMRRQVGAVPVSTQDLPNPFETSIKTNPSLMGR
jgi:hypothetical protein